MINETEVFERFHSAFDAQPSPGAAELLRAALVERLEVARPASAANRGVHISLRFVAGVALIAVAVATTGVFVALHRTVIRPAPAVTPVNHALARSTWGMVSPTVGWELTDWVDVNDRSHILRTTDSGAHWTDVSPPGALDAVGYGSVYILDGSHLWIGQSDYTLRTADGGRTWQRISAWPVTGLDNPSLSFLNASEGWFFDGNALSRTSDGGVSWKEIASHAESCRSDRVPYASTWAYVAFASSSDGWLSVQCAPGMGAVRNLLVTHDGGATWSPQPLPIPADPQCLCVSPIPVVLDHGTAWVRVALPDPATGQLVLMTSDAGRTWTSRTLPGQNQSLVEFLDAKTGWVVSDTGNLYRTGDGGLTWALIGTLPPSRWGASANREVFFVDQQHGFLEDSSSSSYGPDYRGDLLKTTDGGRTWSLIHEMPPLGY